MDTGLQTPKSTKELSLVENELVTYQQLIMQLEGYLQFPPSDNAKEPRQVPSSKVTQLAEALKDLNERLNRCVKEVSNL